MLASLNLGSLISRFLGAGMWLALMGIRVDAILLPLGGSVMT